MDSSSAPGIVAAGALWADPYLWTWAASLFAGLAAGQALRALLRSRRRADADRRRRSRRFARAIAFLSLGILAAAALFVLADKAGLSEAWAGTPLVLLAWSLLSLGFGLCAGFRPLALGLPLAALGLAALGLANLGLRGWLPLRGGAGSWVEVARFLPYEVGPASFRGQLELPERDSMPIAQEAGLASSSIGIHVESLELKGPLRLAAGIAYPRARAASTAYSRASGFYRVVGLAAPGSLGSLATLDFAGPPYARLLDALLPLSGGNEPGGPPARASSPFGLALRTRRTSAASPVAVLEPVVFELSGADYSVRTRSGP
jgi:hypothetical protein